MARRARALIRRIARANDPRYGRPEQSVVSTIDDGQRVLLDTVRPFTMTTPERQVALIDAVDYLHRTDAPGAFVECGVWRGGSVLTMILRLQQLDAEPRHIYLYDTFEGMTQPTEADLSVFDDPALDTWNETSGGPWGDVFGAGTYDETFVRELLVGTGYPSTHLHFVVGDVEQTIPAIVPERIALLRLDTDWYTSTRHELRHLYPLLTVGGVLVVDDYGHWQGARRAVDEYFEGHERPLLLAVDYTCRVGVKRAS